MLFVVVAATYAIGSQLALTLIGAYDLQGAVFVPAGITVAFLLRLRRRHWWIVLLAAGLTELVMDLSGGFGTAQSLGFAVANVIEPLTGALVVAAACDHLDLGRRRDVLWYIAGAVVLGPAIGAAIGASADGLFAGGAWLATFAQWWLGDALGVILVGSAILAWGSSPDRRSLLSPWGVLLLAGSVALTVAVLALSDLPLGFSVLIGVVIAGVAFGVRAVAMTALAVASTIAIMLAVDPGSLIMGLDPSEALVLIKIQVATFALAGLIVAAESHERELAIEQAARSAVESESFERERQRDREVAIRVQRGLLPDSVLRAPGVSVAARYEAASEALEVGGDWYDTIQHSDGRIGVVVGDVVGHGIDAMISMGRLRTALTTLAMHNDSPAGVLTELDQFLSGPGGTGYATVFYAIFDPGRSVLNYASAGHPPGLLITAEGQTVWLDQGQGESLYGKPSIRRQTSIAIERGATLILYSDGLIEQRGESLDLGLNRLARHANDLIGHPPEKICEELLERLTDDRLTDDVVVLTMRFGLDEHEFYEAFPAQPGELGNIRKSIRAWATQRRISEPAQEDLLISIGEATSNVVRHAYRATPAGEVTVRVTMVDTAMDVEVTDNGSWKEPSPEGPEPGMGIDILRSIGDDLRIDGSDRGTIVRFRIATDSSFQDLE